MSLEQTLEEFLEQLQVPKYLNASWLTREYVIKNGWYPVCDEWLQNFPKDTKFENTSFGRIPWKSRSEFKPGDIIIFKEFAEWIDEKGNYDADRFLIIEKEDIEEYKQGRRDLLPVGIVVHPPSIE